MIIRLYATAVVLRFEPGWWQVLGSLPGHEKATASCTPACPLSLSLRAPHFSPGACRQEVAWPWVLHVWLFFLCIYGGCPEGDLEPLFPIQPGKTTSESEGELLSSPSKSMLSHSLFLFHSKLFSSTLGELTLLVNRGVTYFWLHLEIKCHLSYSV